LLIRFSMSDHEQDDPRRTAAVGRALESEPTAERWQTIKGLFAEALDREPKDRRAYLGGACGGDDALLAEVESLLNAAANEEATADPSKPPVQDSLIGRRIGAYKIERQIGSGGMASVYLACRADEEYQKQVAVKILRPELDSGELLRRFRNERQTLATLDHPNIVKLVDGGSSEDGLPFIVMDYVDGTPIDEFCDSRKLSVEERLRLFSEVCAGVECAHRNFVIHRDLKPSNILVTADGTPKLLDFGIAKVLSPPDASQPQMLTQTLGRRMTPAYASPEQVKGTPVTTATDIYSLGVVLYELLTGHRPYKLKQSTPPELERAICEEEPENPSTAVDRVENTTSADGTTVTITPDSVSRARESWPEKLRRRLRGDLDNIVLTALQKEAERRYASVGAFSEDIQRHLDHLPVKARRSTLAYRSTKFVKRHRMGVLTGAMLALVALGGAVFVRWEEKSAAEKARAEVAGDHIPGRRSVAVLGFKNLSGRSETLWVSTALSEMLRTELAAGGRLRIISGETVANMKSDLSLPETDSLARGTLTRVRKNLGSDYVLLGSYLDLGGNGSQQVRFDMRLQDAAAGETIAAVALDGVETDLSDLVVRAGTSLREKLGAGTVSPEEAASLKATQPSNPETLRLYAEGLAKLRAFDALGARDLLEKAVDADPSFALAHSALGEAWGTLGYDAKAAEEARKAFDLAGGLPREEGLLIEARYRQAARERDKVVEIYRTLFNFFPDNLDHGLQLVSAQLSAGRPADALTTVQALRKIAPPARDDPRVDLAEARVAGALSDNKRQASAAAQAARRGEAVGARLLVARARLDEASGLAALGDAKRARAELQEAQQLFVAGGDRSGEARALRAIGSISIEQGDFDAAKKALDESMKIQHEVGNRASELDVLGQIANLLYGQGDVGGSKQASEQSLSIAREIGDRPSEGKALILIGAAEIQQEEFGQAKAHLQEALAIERYIGNQDDTANALNTLGGLLAAQGDFSGARRAFNENLQISRRTGKKFDIGTAFLNLAGLQVNYGEPAPAQKLFAEALKIFKETGNQQAVCITLSGMGEILSEEGDLDGARKNYTDALEIQEKIGDKGNAAYTRVELAGIAVKQGRATEAEGLARQAVEASQAAKDLNEEAGALCRLAESLRVEGKLTEAQSVIDSARKLGDKSGDVGVQLPATIEYARLQAAVGKTGEAIKLLEDAIEQARKAHILPFQLEARLALGETEIKSSNSTVGRVDLKALEQEARSKGFLLIAREAAAARNQRTTSARVADSQ
jgi:serine/threonine protein kinase/tetratricopeptide (TPR) repeat protein